MNQAPLSITSSSWRVCVCTSSNAARGQLVEAWAEHMHRAWAQMLSELYAVAGVTREAW
jgi:hypothetical protein